MFDFKNTQLSSSICLLLATSSLGAALPKPPARYLNSTVTQSQPQDTPLAAPAVPNDAFFQAPGSKYKAPMAMPEKAYTRDLKWQPYMDFDKDGCYNSVAINKYGDMSSGIYVSPDDYGFGLGNDGRSRDCRSKADLSNTNVYVRRRCNRGVCAYLYAYYFVKDAGIFTGHRHDWEHVVVWTVADKGTYKNEKLQTVGVSAHGNFETKDAADIRMDGTHPKVVYHLGANYGWLLPGSTHSLRFAKKDDDKIENHSGAWFRGPLLSWNRVVVSLLEKLKTHDFGSAHLALKDGDFTKSLVKSMPGWARKREFDCAHDEPGVDFEF